MRYDVIFLAIIALSGCTLNSAPIASNVPTVASTFVVPMDPGQISCASLSNSVALAEATNWTLGRARAAELSGRINNAPTAEALSQDLAGYCSANSTQTLASAAAQLGF